MTSLNRPEADGADRQQDRALPASEDEIAATARDDSRDAGEKRAQGHAFGRERNAPPGVEGDDDVIGDNDASMRASGEAGALGGVGSRGYGGAAGGAPNYGGVGTPGGGRRLGSGPSQIGDAQEGGTAATGGLGASGIGAIERDYSGELPATGDWQQATSAPDPLSGSAPYQPARAGKAPNHQPGETPGRLSVAGGSGGSGSGGAHILHGIDEHSGAHDEADQPRQSEQD